MSHSLVTTSCSGPKEARKIMEALLRKKLSACVKMSAVSSSHWWNGKVERSGEVSVSAITTKANVDRVMAEIKKIHSYDVPEIIVTPITKGDKRYLRWVDEVTE